MFLYTTDMALIARDAPATLPRHRHGLSRGTVRASQEMRVMEATASVVADKGYAATSVNAIIERAGVSRKTFYELYANKEEAFLGAYAAIDIVIGRMTAAAAAHENPRERMRAGAREYLETLADEPDFTRMLVIEAVGAGPRVLARRAEAFKAFTRVLALALDDPPEQALLLALLGGINELVLEQLLESGAVGLAELTPTVHELIDRICFPRDLKLA
jgi:AcrR family transcriptional regulator